MFSNPTITSIAVLTVIYAGATTAWNIFAGYTGYIALGHAVFFGAGAYALAILCKDWHVTSDYGPILMLPICGLIAAVIAVPLGAIALRARSHTFVVITIAMFFIAQLLVYNLRDLTNGSAGLELPIPSWTFDVYNLPFYYSGLVILLLALATSWWVRRSKYGLGLLAIRDDEERALGLGVKTGPSKLHCLRHLGPVCRHARRFVGLLYRVRLPAVRLQCALRRVLSFAGIPGWHWHTLGANPRRGALDSRPRILRSGFDA